jgi:ethanolamine utilization protein EutJ
VTKSIPHPLGRDPEVVLSRAYDVILPNPNGRKPSPSPGYDGPLHVGVDLGTAYTVLAILDQEGTPIAGEYRLTQVVRDGLVVDYISAVDILREMKQNLEVRLGRQLTHAASGYPPGVSLAEVRSTANVVEAAGMHCPELIPEPTAANRVLGITDGVIADIGGGTTGIAIIKHGQVVYTADEATGGTHMSLVIAGGANITFEEAEAKKKDPAQQSRLFPIIRPVMEKMGTIIKIHIRGHDAQSITLVGGTSLFPGIDRVIQEITGVPTQVAPHPLFVTPVGIAMHDQPDVHGYNT